MGTIPTNHGDHVNQNHIYPACATCVASLTSAEVAALDNILATSISGLIGAITWVNREVLQPGVLQPGG